MSDDDIALTQISLSHGQARWVLRHFNMSASETDASFDALLKSLRRDGIPFAPEETGRGAGHNLAYRFEHLMELALALAFRTQGILARDLVNLIAQNRDKLRAFFRRAYLERDTGLGEARGLYITDQKPTDSDPMAQPHEFLVNISGAYLDLSLVMLPGGMMGSFKFNLLGPQEAVKVFMMGHQNLYPRPPLPLSDIASDVVRLASGPIPEFRRGR